MKKKTQKENYNQHLKDKSFVLTGALDQYSRKEASRLIRQHGGDVKSSVSSKTTYLVVGENPGSKYEKAQDLNIEIIDEDAFDNLLKGGH